MVLAGYDATPEEETPREPARAPERDVPPPWAAPSPGAVGSLRASEAGEIMRRAKDAGDKAGVHGFRVISHVLKDLGLPTPPVGTKSAGMVEHLRAHVTYPRLETFLRGCDAYKLEPEEPMESVDGVPF